jgi:hypothetical protein
VLVNIGPAELLTAAGIKPAWRFVGEQEWRLPGVPVGGLATGDGRSSFGPCRAICTRVRESLSCDQRCGGHGAGARVL